MNNIIKTFGCRLNIFETEVIKNFITKNKMKNVSVLNTCAVTKEAEKKAQREIKKIKNKNKNSFLVVTGCASQLKPETFEQMKHIFFGRCLIFVVKLAILVQVGNHMK